MRFPRCLSPFLLPALSAFFLTSCGDNGTTPPDADATAGARIAAEDGQTPDNGMIVIDTISATQSGWIVIHRDNGAGEPATPGIIGKGYFDSGTTVRLSLLLDSAVSDGEKLWGMLHSDDGEIGTYEFNGEGTPDQPISNDGRVVTASFTISQTDPMVAAGGQLPIDNGLMIRSTATPENGWIVIHANVNGGPGPVLAYAAVSKGMNTDVRVTLPDDPNSPVRSGDTLWGMLHYDRGAEGTYEFPGADIPARFRNGEIVMIPLVITEPVAPSIAVSDQEVIEKRIVVDKVIVPRPGWITVQRDNGKGGPISGDGIGHAYILTGENTNVSVTLSESVSKGGTLWIVLHDDDGTPGVFDYPDFDLPFLVDGEKVAVRFTIK